jgi:hypothetical protein
MEEGTYLELSFELSDQEGDAFTIEANDFGIAT